MTDIEKTIEDLVRIYDKATKRLRADILKFAEDGSLTSRERRSDGSYAYPELVLTYDGGEPRSDRTRAYGRFSLAGTYTTTVTRPELFADYLREQLSLITEDYEVTLSARASRQEIPFPYVLDGAAGAELAGISPQVLARHFPHTDLADIGDELADGIELEEPDQPIPLSLFDGLRTDFSLARLAHYTGTQVDDFQRYVLFTNYHRYVDEFVDWAGAQLGSNGFTKLAGAGGLELTERTENARHQLSDTAWRRHQMPAYHLVGEGHGGITLVNIGVGPSNAKTICDHLAVLRPEAWLMIGHCGGLRGSQRIGDYVLAHAYLRDDHVLDPVLPPEIPLPAIAEVQQALVEAASQVSGEESGRSEKADAHRHRGYHRRPQLGATLLRQRAAAFRSAAQSASTWKAPPSPRKATASASPTAPCYAFRTSRFTARSSCRGRQTPSTKKPSPPTCRSA